MSINTLPAEHETSNALVGTWSDERSTPSITERNSARTERLLTRLVVHSPVCIKPKERKHVAHTIHVLIVHLCCLLSQYTHNTSWFTIGFHFAHGSGAYGCSTWIHGSTSSRPLMSCVQGWSVSMTIDIKTCTLGKPKSHTD